MHRSKRNVLLHKGSCGRDLFIVRRRNLDDHTPVRTAGSTARAAFCGFGVLSHCGRLLGPATTTGCCCYLFSSAIWAAERRHIFLAVIALTVGTLLKFLPILLLPLVVVYSMRGVQTWRSRARIFVGAVLIFGGLTVVAYQPYWAGTRTLQNITVRENFVTTAPLAVVSYGLRQPAGLKYINELLVTLHLPHPAENSDIVAGVSRTGSGLLALGLLWQLWHIWWRGRGIWQAVFGLLLWYLTLGSQWFEPWYVLWLLGLLALRPDRRVFGWVTAWSLAGQASYLCNILFNPQLGKRLGTSWERAGRTGSGFVLHNHFWATAVGLGIGRLRPARRERLLA